jgi:Mn-dependent DtxR family transcriptional regulator
MRRERGVQHILRAVYESSEKERGRADAGPLELDVLLAQRSWSRSRLRRLLNITRRRGLVTWDGSHVTLTQAGWREATRLVRNHRLWELYLIQFADIAPSHVDQDADRIEHVLDSETLAELERLLRLRQPDVVPASPHRLAGGSGTRSASDLANDTFSDKEP